jgi:hypothetical protein
MTGPRIVVLALLLLISLPAAAETVVIEAGRDTTLIENPDGALANGSGPGFWVGRTAQAENGRRRGLLHFDVAAALPENALVVSARLTLHMASGNSRLGEVRLQRVQADWGEGASYATGGSGDLSAPGDATWVHTFHDDERWVRSGGQFLARISASQDVGGSGPYTWESNVHLVQDVRLWHRAPQRNFGWILIGDETAPRTAKIFASREEPDPSLRPALEVTYRLPGRP